LTIAGSDSGGGAGMQADLKTFAALGVFGTAAVTALTAQNTAGVEAVYAPPAAFVDREIETVLDDFDVRAVKTGMLANTEIVEVVALRAASGGLPNLVVDPVLVASSGDPLFVDRPERAYLEQLFPHALVVTPNLREAGRLLDRNLVTVDDMIGAALTLRETGAQYVVVKGGHLPGDEAVDVVFDGADVTLLSAPRIDTANNHGTGCTFASAIAARLARGDDVLSAIRAAKDFVTRAISGSRSWQLGRPGGHGPLDHFGWDTGELG
jgi:hydroxymethylpyrimidine/phosphomethylpyrimidine kinase